MGMIYIFPVTKFTNRMYRGKDLTVALSLALRAKRNNYRITKVNICIEKY